MPEEEVPPLYTKADFDRFSSFMDEFNGESDRAAVILGAAKIDQTLFELLSATLLPLTSGKDDLLESDGPIGSFSARISLAYRMALIDAELAHALHMVRKIRNAFAHEPTGCKLDGGPEGDRVRTLAQPFRHFKDYNEFRDLMTMAHTGYSGEFRAVLALLLGRLTGRLRSVERISGVPMALVPPGWKRTNPE
jgi:hypothetical protein